MSYVLSGPAAERLAVAVASLAAAVTAISDDYIGGDLPLESIATVQRAFEQASAAAMVLQNEATKLATRQSMRGEAVDLSSITDALRRADFDADVSVFQSGVVLLGERSAAWNAEVGPRLAAAIPPVRLELTTRPTAAGNVETQQLRMPTHIPEIEGLAIKNSQALADLRAALVTLKAI